MTMELQECEKADHRRPLHVVVYGPPGIDLLHPAYLAGIFDGEGSIYSRRRGTPYVSVASTCRSLIDALWLFGGAIQDRTGRQNSLGAKPIWEWTITAEAAALLLRAALPYMVIKADAAQVVLDEWDVTTFTMRNPRKRRTHIARVRAEFEHWKYPVSGPDLSALPCANGHPMTPENTYVSAEGSRCWRCKKESAARRRMQRA